MNAPPRRILLVEDNCADAVLLEEMLRRADSARFDLTVADRLEKALAQLEGASFDAVLLDLTLPDAQGLATLDRLLPMAAATPIIVLTAIEDEGLAIKAIRQGAQDYLVKGTLEGRGIARAIHYAIDRKRAEEEVRQAQERESRALAAATAAQAAASTIQAMGEGVLLMNVSGNIVSMNPAMASLCGHAEDALLGRALGAILPALFGPEDARAIDAAIVDLWQGKAPAPAPLTLLAANGRRVPVIPSFAFVHGADNTPSAVIVTLRDITPLMQAREDLEASERKYRELVEYANTIIMRRTIDGRITFFNEFAQKFFGYREEELLGRNVVGTITPEIDSAGNRLEPLITDIGAHPESHLVNENENVCRDGRRVWVQWANRALRNAEGTVLEILCIGTDATLRRQAEESRRNYQAQLRSLAAKLSASEEHERRRISRVLHDTVIQDLSLSRIKLGGIRAALDKAGLREEVAQVDTLRELVDDSIRHSRLLMADLAPPMLYELGLGPALDDLAVRIERQHGVPVKLEYDGKLDSIEMAVRGFLYQSARELIMNALKHAAPRLIEISCHGDKAGLRLSVADDGAGFDLVKASGRRDGALGGFGLFTIRERVEDLGGCLDIQSNPGNGTRVTILLPVSRVPQAKLP